VIRHRGREGWHWAVRTGGLTIGTNTVQPEHAGCAATQTPAARARGPHSDLAPSKTVVIRHRGREGWHWAVRSGGLGSSTYTGQPGHADCPADQHRRPEHAGREVDTGAAVSSRAKRHCARCGQLAVRGTPGPSARALCKGGRLRSAEPRTSAQATRQNGQAVWLTAGRQKAAEERGEAALCSMRAARQYGGHPGRLARALCKGGRLRSAERQTAAQAARQFGTRPQLASSTGRWQAAEERGEAALCGCNRLGSTDRPSG
jgi:hypothetical protein